jgi:hypothetical protein
LSRRFTETRPPPNADDLPADLRKQMEEPVPTKMTDLEMAALNGELENIPDSVSVPEVHLTNSDIKEVTEIKRDKVDIEETMQQKAISALKELEDETTAKQFNQLVEYCKNDTFDIKFDDVTTKNFYRAGLKQDLTEQIKDLQIELETLLYLEGDNEGQKISKRELRLIRKKRDKLALNYLKDSSTHKTLTEEQAKKMPGSLLTNIIESCIYRTTHDIVEKNL